MLWLSVIIFHCFKIRPGISFESSHMQWRQFKLTLIVQINYQQQTTFLLFSSEKIRLDISCEFTWNVKPYFFFSRILSSTILAGLGGSVGCVSDWWSGGCRFDPHRQVSNIFVEIEHEIFSMVILSLLLIQEGQLSASGKRMCTILVNRLED